MVISYPFVSEDFKYYYNNQGLLGTHDGAKVRICPLNDLLYHMEICNGMHRTPASAFHMCSMNIFLIE